MQRQDHRGDEGFFLNINGNQTIFITPQNYYVTGSSNKISSRFRVVSQSYLSKTMKKLFSIVAKYFYSETMSDNYILFTKKKLSLTPGVVRSSFKYFLEVFFNLPGDLKRGYRCLTLYQVPHSHLFSVNICIIFI